MSDEDRGEFILVTGASGFLGGQVTRTLLDQGYQVVAHHYQNELPPGLAERCHRVVRGDLCQAEVQQDAIRNAQVVCHLAAFIPASFLGIPDAGRCHAINAQASAELATQALQAGVRRFILFSAGNMYAPRADRPCHEADSIFPDSYATDYLVSKFSAEAYLMNLCRNTPMGLVILRVATPYGPGEPGKKVIPTFLRLAAEGKPLRLVDGGRARFNFVYVSDVADLVARAIERSRTGIFNVGSGESTSLLELAQANIALHADREVELNVEPETNDGFSGFPAISIDAAREAFDYAPRSLADGLKAYRTSLNEGKDLP
jgi:UDP-glucose 4-epimerase